MSMLAEKDRTVWTPWGMADYVKNYTEGLDCFGTPSHGGFGVSDELMRDMEPTLAAFKTWAGRNWYEEDCDCIIVVLAFPQYFGERHLRCAVDALRHDDRKYFEDGGLDVDRFFTTDHAKAILHRLASQGLGPSRPVSTFETDRKTKGK